MQEVKPMMDQRKEQQMQNTERCLCCPKTHAHKILTYTNTNNI